MVPLASVNSSVPLANSSTVIVTELIIGISNTIPSHSTSSHYIRVALWQGTGVKLSSKATAYEHFYVSHSALVEPYAYLPTEAYDGNVGNDIKLKHPKIMTNNSKVCSMNRTN